MTKYKWLAVIAALFYLLVAYQSSGFHNLDEHYQIIEFANYKLGILNQSGLAWEFNAQIRPTLQPTLCFLIFKAAYLLGITDVYTLAFLLRAITGLLAVFVIHKFIVSSNFQVDKKYHWPYAIMSYFLWFLPYVNVRFSSEAWSGLLFLLSLAIIQNVLNKSQRKNILLGVVFGIAILFRYQTALLVLGAALWLIFVARYKFANIVIIALSVLGVLFLGLLIDWWFYGEMAFTLFNYFYVNIVEDVASNYGVSPWYEIILHIVNGPGPVGIFMFAAFFLLLIRQPKHIILWVSFPFLLTHMVIPHKELRFLFPLVNLVPLLLVLGYQQIAGMVHSGKHLQLPWRVACAVFIITNLAGLLVVATKGAGDTKVSVTEYIHKHYADEKINVLYIRGLNPYYDWHNLRNSFYNSKGIRSAPITTVWQDDFLTKRRTGYTNLLIISNDDITGPRTVSRLRELGLVKVFQSIPEIDQKILSLYKSALNDDNLLLYVFSDEHFSNN